MPMLLRLPAIPCLRAATIAPSRSHIRELPSDMPGPTGSTTNSPTIDSGTLVLGQSPQPGSLGMCTATGPRDNTWGYWQAIKWKLLPEWLGGGPQYARNYKDAWVFVHREQIKKYAELYQIPDMLLAGVAWVEVGGKPYRSKLELYDLRKDLRNSPTERKVVDAIPGLKKVDKDPGQTSTGAVAIQLRRAAEASGFDFNQLNGQQQDQLIGCLQVDENNLAIVAKHLWQLQQVDFPRRRFLGPYPIRIIASRYNRGPELTLKQILANTSYGDFIVDKIWDRLQTLLTMEKYEKLPYDPARDRRQKEAAAQRMSP
jgi:hypothetical protein